MSIQAHRSRPGAPGTFAAAAAAMAPQPLFRARPGPAVRGGWRVPTTRSLVRNSRVLLLILALLWVLRGMLVTGPAAAALSSEADAAAAAAAKGTAARPAKGAHAISARSPGSKPGAPGAKPKAPGGGAGKGGGGGARGAGAGATKGVRAPSPVLRPGGGGGGFKGSPPSKASAGLKAHTPTRAKAAAHDDAANDADDDKDGAGAAARNKARPANAVCNATQGPRPTLDGLPFIMPFSRGVMGKRGKLSKNDLFIHRGNYAKNRMTEVVPDPAVLPESADAVWEAYPFRRCALVGNSGSLLGAGLGAAIDAHDVVAGAHSRSLLSST